MVAMTFPRVRCIVFSIALLAVDMPLPVDAQSLQFVNPATCTCLTQGGVDSLTTKPCLNYSAAEAGKQWFSFFRGHYPQVLHVGAPPPPSSPNATYKGMSPLVVNFPESPMIEIGHSMGCLERTFDGTLVEVSCNISGWERLEFQPTCPACVEVGFPCSSRMQACGVCLPSAIMV